ncbi:hypothetical protein PHYSODRAFT_505479 [Phytophthora sojae]|uniref:Auto-transporter adhesin head GIN domain-containing protein n=1 Tax=Phytophthora sojae (strain P6497) TaxID=1094619 RepID=G4ZQJ3_PHYSP|nr:hypothetical protein PHYSODRAFT_505479 [Phytophthora sojae]EGZ15521.1 hypothetical protein PHYSODRAFT_505479 [Phytophthora sojae]|eukprot:XP_009529270.1 hypothetical protein PHYSODRAFT_505479 [Phytophthora sojae]
MNIQALLLVAASMTARASAEFTVTSAVTEAATSTSENAAFVKQWTLSAVNSADTIDSIDLDLAGRVYVSYVSGLPSGVLGYVNVSGDSQTVVDAVTVTNDDTNDNDADDTNDTDGELNIRIGNSTSTATTLSGYLLTEIFLASTGVVTDVKSQRSAQVVVEDGVLASNSTTAELQVETSGSSAVYVSAASTDVSARQLHLEATGTSKLQFIVDSVSVTELELETQGTGTICISAQQVTATTYEGKGASRISMPNASNKHDSTGSLTCDESSVPAREPSCVSSACASSSTAGTAGSTTGNVDSSESSTTRLAALAAALIGAAAASLL